VARFEHGIREICVRIVRAVQEKQTFDAIPLIAAELPAQVVASILVVPEEDRHLIVSWANDMFGRMDPEIEFEKGTKAHQVADGDEPSCEIGTDPPGISGHDRGPAAKLLHSYRFFHMGGRF
jgi:hypothetical protein